MSAPRHLWSGDWRLDSAAAAEELARRRAEVRSPPNPPNLNRRTEARLRGSPSGCARCARRSRPGCTDGAKGAAGSAVVWPVRCGGTERRCWRYSGRCWLPSSLSGRFHCWPGRATTAPRTTAALPAISASRWRARRSAFRAAGAVPVCQRCDRHQRDTGQSGRRRGAGAGRPDHGVNNQPVTAPADVNGDRAPARRRSRPDPVRAGVHDLHDERHAPARPPGLSMTFVHPLVLLALLANPAAWPGGTRASSAAASRPRRRSSLRAEPVGRTATAAAGGGTRR